MRFSLDFWVIIFLQLEGHCVILVPPVMETVTVRVGRDPLLQLLHAPLKHMRSNSGPDEQGKTLLLLPLVYSPMVYSHSGNDTIR